jgi:hypothetical protein
VDGDLLAGEVECSSPERVELLRSELGRRARSRSSGSVRSSSGSALTIEAGCPIERMTVVAVISKRRS